MKSQVPRESIKVALYTLGLVAFILGAASLTGFGYTVVMAKRVSEGIIQADAYVSAKEAVAEEESLERKYRLEPNQAIRARYGAASSELQRSLNDIGQLGTSFDKHLRDEVLRDHAKYLQVTYRMFVAVDAADWKLVQEIDTHEVDPIFDKIEIQVNNAADAHRRFALDSVAKFLQIQYLVFFGLVAIVVIVLLLLAGFVWMYARERHFSQATAESEYRSQHDALTGLPKEMPIYSPILPTVAACRCDNHLTELVALSS